MGRFSISATTLVDEAVDKITCPHYERLLKAALFLLVSSHPVLRREVEMAPKDGPERERWQRVEYSREDGTAYETFAEYVAECWG
jgi:hypothetical protein